MPNESISRSSNADSFADRGPVPIVSIFVVSAAVLDFEILLTRLFSITYWHHFAALLISLALIGFGAAGSMLSLVMERGTEKRAELLLYSSLAAAISMPLCYSGALAVGLEPLALAWTLNAWPALFLVCFILIVPFFFGAVHIGLILSWSARPSLHYAFNLAGSAAGCLAAAVGLSYLSPHHCLYIPAVSALAASIPYLTLVPTRPRVVWLTVVAAATVFLFFHPVPLQFEAFKDRSAALSALGSKVENQRPGLHSLVEVIGGPAFHYAPGLNLGCEARLPEQKGLFIDGDLAGPITRMEPGGDIPAAAMCLMLHLPFRLFRPQKVLLLNPDGGLPVLAALSETIGRVTAVESNPQVFSMMSGPCSDFSGGLYNHPQVTALRKDPIVFLTETRDRYDLILLGYQGGGPGLAVTRMLTIEELGRLLGRLTPNGVLAVSGPLMSPPRASIKMAATMALALQHMKIPPGEALALVRDWNTCLFLARPRGFTQTDLDGLRKAADEMSFDFAYLPGASPDLYNRRHHLPEAPVSRGVEEVLSNRAKLFFREYPFHIRPPTRDRPYFYRFFKLNTLSLILDSEQGRPLAATEWGLLFSWGGFLAVLILAALGIFPPLIKIRPRPKGLLFFSLIGLGYMMAEISLLSETIYRLSRPTLAIPLVIGVFLLFSGLGSLFWGNRPPMKFTLAAALSIPASFLGVRYIPGFIPGAVLALAPAALVMGAPFAGGLAHLAGPRVEAKAWAFGVNGFFSVVGSMAAGLACPQLGHTLTVILASGCYLLAGLVSLTSFQSGTFTALFSKGHG